MSTTRTPSGYEDVEIDPYEGGYELPNGCEVRGGNKYWDTQQSCQIEVTDVLRKAHEDTVYIFYDDGSMTWNRRTGKVESKGEKRLEAEEFAKRVGGDSPRYLSHRMNNAPPDYHLP